MTCSGCGPMPRSSPGTMMDRSDAMDDHDPFDKLLAQTELLLHTGNLQAAEKAALELVDRFPNSTSAFELTGDVYATMGKSALARKHYLKAMELEPSNVDVERKFASALVAPSPEEQRLQMIRELVADSDQFKSSSRRPLNAVLAAILFAGLGQLYNRQYEKGLALFATAAVLLMLLFKALVMEPWAKVAQNAGKQALSFSEQAFQAREMLADMPAGWWGLVVCGIIVYLAVYAYGIYDTYVTAHQQNEIHRTLGV
jgi:tetratricopeptide (TPR) repeat protein